MRFSLVRRLPVEKGIERSYSLLPCFICASFYQPYLKFRISTGSLRGSCSRLSLVYLYAWPQKYDDDQNLPNFSVLVGLV